MARWLRQSWRALVLAMICTAATPIRTIRADTNDEARILFEAGVTASQAERWPQAHDYFKRSLALVQKPSTLFNLAVAELKLGRAREALASLDAFERIADPHEHASLIERAQALRAEAEARARKDDGRAPIAELIEIADLSGEAEALYLAGREAYWAGRYDRALEYFERANELAPRPELLYDVGAAADRVRDDERALHALQGFVAARPSAPQAPAVRMRITVLERVLRERQRSSEQPAQPAPEPSEPATVEQYSLRAPVTLLVAGPLLMGSSFATYRWWWKERADTEDRCNEAGRRCRNISTVVRQKRIAMASTITLGALGLGCVVYGSILLARRKHAPEASTAFFDLAPGGGLLGYQRSF